MSSSSSITSSPPLPAVVGPQVDSFDLPSSAKKDVYNNDDDKNNDKNGGNDKYDEKTNNNNNDKFANHGNVNNDSGNGENTIDSNNDIVKGFKSPKGITNAYTIVALNNNNHNAISSSSNNSCHNNEMTNNYEASFSSSFSTSTILVDQQEEKTAFCQRLHDKVIETRSPKAIAEKIRTLIKTFNEDKNPNWKWYKDVEEIIYGGGKKVKDSSSLIDDINNGDESDMIIDGGSGNEFVVVMEPEKEVLAQQNAMDVGSIQEYEKMENSNNKRNRQRFHELPSSSNKTKPISSKPNKRRKAVNKSSSSVKILAKAIRELAVSREKIWNQKLALENDRKNKEFELQKLKTEIERSKLEFQREELEIIHELKLRELEVQFNVYNNTITHTEANTNLTYNVNRLNVLQGINYDDGSILLRFTKSSATPKCNENILFLRLILPNGDIKELNIQSDKINYSNFCENLNVVGNVLPPSSTYIIRDSIVIYGITNKLILVKYFCNPPDVNLTCGLILDWNGNDLGSIKFNNQSCTDSNIVANIDSQYGGFLWVCFIEENKQLLWTKYDSFDVVSGSSPILASGALPNINEFSPNFTQIFPTEDGGYGVVMAKFNPTSTTTDIPPPWTIDVTFIPPSTYGNETGPFLIYSQNVEAIKRLNIYRCSITYYKLGYSCIIYVERISGNVYIDILFVSSGKLEQKEFSTNLTNGLIVWDIKALYYGGYIILTELNEMDHIVINGLIFSNDGTPYDVWNFTNNYPSLDYTRVIGVLPNNTLWGVVNETTVNNDNNSWTLTSTFVNYSTILGGGSNSGIPETSDYGPSFISSTFPTINSTIPLSSLPSSTLNITYTIPVNILRQTISPITSPDYFTLSNNNQTISFNFIASTFNIPDQQYYITVDNTFVKDRQYNQNVLGSSEAIIRLNKNGTTYYRSSLLSSLDDRKFFSNALSKELAAIIPCDPDRLTVSTNYQFDHNGLVDQLVLLKIYVQGLGDVINDNNILDKLSSDAIIYNLDILIRHKNITGISISTSSSLLDENFGSLRILIDLGFDIAFVILHGEDLDWLYPASMVFLIFPICLNTLFTFYLVSNETAHETNFVLWWRRNSKTALLCTLFSGADIECLNFISSGFANLEALSAPISLKTKRRIFWIQFITIFIEDLPQCIVLVIFKILPSIIPVLALISSVLMLLLKSINNFYLKKRPNEDLTNNNIISLPDIGSPIPPLFENNHSSNDEYETPYEIETDITGAPKFQFRKDFDMPSTKPILGRRVVGIVHPDDDGDTHGEMSMSAKGKSADVGSVVGSSLQQKAGEEKESSLS
ncbi:3417_t:CDS:10, partial [Entrophospora sp. SA101]